MREKVAERVITVSVALAFLALLGGGLWWGAGAAYDWFDNWAKGEQTQQHHEWHLRQRQWVDEADQEHRENAYSGSQVQVEVLRQVWVDDANDPEESTSVGDLGSGFKATDATVEITTHPKYGKATLEPDGILTYTADNGYVGPDSVDWSVKLNQAPETVTGTVYIDVEPEPEGEPWVPPGERWPGAFENCAEAEARGRAPVRKGEPGYAPWLDADDDGTGCDAG